MPELPDYFLTRPAVSGRVAVGSFERLYIEQVRDGRAIDYRLDAPVWQFLCWLADTQAVVLHGSSRADIDEFEPRRPDDRSPVR